MEVDPTAITSIGIGAKIGPWSTGSRTVRCYRQVVTREGDDQEKPSADTSDARKVLGIPHDWSRPTVQRAKSRLYNSEDVRLFPPKSFGAGWTINFYWILHPFEFRRKRASPKRS